MFKFILFQDRLLVNADVGVKADFCVVRFLKLKINQTNLETESANQVSNVTGLTQVTVLGPLRTSGQGQLVAGV